MGDKKDRYCSKELRHGEAFVTVFALVIVSRKPRSDLFLTQYVLSAVAALTAYRVLMV
jgi:hypothetical protein